MVDLPVSPVEPLAIAFSLGDPATRFQHLPPIQLKFDLPEAYPLEAPPVIELTTSPAWLPTEKLEVLKKECLGLWEEYGHGQVVFAIIDHVQQRIERGLGISGALLVPAELQEELVAFNQETKRKKFDQETYDCGICLEPKKGVLCHQLRSCIHVFCRPCLRKKKALAADPKTIYCPRQWCQAPSRASVENVEASMKIIPQPIEEHVYEADSKKKVKETVSPLKEKLQVCSTCSLAFCSKCLASWHGDFQICKPADGTLTEEELANEKFLRENTTPCPTCETPVLKSHGCNHMICTCATHFCFLCSAYLPAENPYFHYNTIGTDCYQRLWEGESGDIENQRLIEAGVRPLGSEEE
ncbi:hypothetical protein BZA05DRAFT_424770 [Tricharina praecox]|uniref:uncharacterized protein n=1 Tax=Tricharina praecox TaxID=43433 RepID=UPI0022201CA8|nr:uncharacterized protein BZA05DRAFT_424770 [Tricharina praecox]KAI5854726.1 hypothetical protein BZA05DRAFT_424770 [Tricharina praecox]